ncbi:DUF4062 domain-containing protein [Serratia fonticola]|uniref:DUF4062 domain-containing protein n=1 Tax=Serratia fonticola TaxID=47917 RepID=UPI00217A29C9|nr:DUF4062 domain-containing protein [Serratia fonticola]CAI1016371.1 Uncharacterised protein [Serratia fonticola]
MDKRYQVFVSSTFRDLIEERQQVTTALMKMNCIPAGMELFPAIDMEQFEFIKKIIDDSDYYLIMIAGKYGSISPETGVSYTEMEFDYAVERGLKIIALIHENINTLTRDKIELDPEIANKLENFTKKASKSRLVNYWTNLNEIPGYVAINLSQTITMFPAEGWVRSRNATSETTLIDLNELRKENEALKEKLQSYNQLIPNLVELTSIFKLTGTYVWARNGKVTIEAWEYKCSWSEIFAMIAPSLISLKSNDQVKHIIAKIAVEKLKGAPRNTCKLNDNTFNIIKVQMLAYNFVDIKTYPTQGGGSGEFWKVTELGRNQMLQSISLKA